MTYSFATEVVYPKFTLTSSFGPPSENHIEDDGTIEFNNRSDKEKFKLLEKLND